MFKLIYRKFGNRIHTKDDLLSGLTVALALVPEAIAFAIIAGVSPIIGLYAAFMVCLITSIAGGRPGMISGATGALGVVMVSLVILGNERGAALGLGADMGGQYLFATVILMGVIQLGCGGLKLGRFVRLIPQPVMFGFVNGLAIVIFEAQSRFSKAGRQRVISHDQLGHVNHGDNLFPTKAHHTNTLLARRHSIRQPSRNRAQPEYVCR